MVLRVHEDLVYPAPLGAHPHHHQHHRAAHHHNNAHAHNEPRIPQMNMMKVHIPFTFKLLDIGNLSYQEVQYSMSSQVHYTVHLYWGVNIRELHISLWKPWSALRDQAVSETLLAGQYQYPGLITKKFPHLDEADTLHLTHTLDLGSPPRLFYPLVIFLIRSDSNDNIHPDETVALINVIHIKDNVCPLPTSILAQYLKQANGQLSCLKQLYLATGNAVGSYDSSEMSVALAEPMNDSVLLENATNEQLCVVCQFFPLSRALLPCRHTCICASCFDKVDRCPMCRGPINSYFCIRSEEYMPVPSQKAADSEHGAFYNLLDHWNDRLIDFLGFQR